MTKHNITPTTRNFITLIYSLVLFGIFMIYDTTPLYSRDFLGSAYKLLLLQIIWIIAGSICFFICYFIDYHSIAKWSQILFKVNIVILVLLAGKSILTRFGIISCMSDAAFMPCVNSAYRWFFINSPPLPALPLFGVVGLQPGELAKLTLLLYLAFQLNKHLEEDKPFFRVFATVVILIPTLIALQPNMSTAILIFLICILTYFIADGPVIPMLGLVATLSIIGVSLIMLFPHSRGRILAYLGKDSSVSSSTKATAYHVRQISIALGSGGLSGVGIGQSRQKFQYLPEVAADSIFAIIGEELGLIGTVSILGVFMVLLYQGYSIAKRAPDITGRVLAAGITTWIGLQFFINVASMTQVIPLTGIPIPLISYGGSSMVFSLAALGIVASVGKSCTDIG